MKILIAYYTKTGTTAKCAAMLRSYFYLHDMTLADLSTEEPDIAAYDAVILGAPIRMGRLDKRMRNYLKENERVFALKPIGLFVCCGEPETAQDIMLKDIPRELYETAVAVGNFGGEFDVSAQKSFPAKVFVWLMRRSIRRAQVDEDISEEDKPIYPEIRPDDIRRFADSFKQYF